MSVAKNVSVQLYKIISNISTPTFICASKFRCNGLSIKKTCLCQTYLRLEWQMLANLVPAYDVGHIDQ